MLKYEIDKKKFSELKDKIAIPKFQRGLVWNKEKKREFIKTLKKGLPIGVLLLSKKDDQYLVIDGLQRFTTMKEYSRDYFSYVEKEEISDIDILNLIWSSKKSMAIYNSFKPEDQTRSREKIRDIITDKISEGFGKNNLAIARSIVQELVKDALFNESDSEHYVDEAFALVERFSNTTSIDDIEIPLILFKGDEQELASIYQKLNQEGVKLSKYDVFAATWINHTVFVKDDPEFINFIIQKYENAKKESSLEISNYDPEGMKQTGELTVFEYCFALGKAIMNSCPKLFPKADDSKIDSIGFLILAELLGLSYQKMGLLAEQIEQYQSINFRTLKEDIIDSCKIVESALTPYIVSPSKKKVSLVCHSELQLVSYIIVIFMLKYSLSKDGIEQKKNCAKDIKLVKQFLYKHYLYDILRGFWSGSGDSKLEDIIADPYTCRYMKDVDKSGFENTLTEWLAEANKKKTQNTITAESKLFLNYLLRGNVHDVEKRDYDIEHCVPKKTLDDFFKKKKIEVPISTVCNLVYIPSSENRSKQDLTYYQKQDKDASTYKLKQDELDLLVYPRRDEIRFVESVSTLTEAKYRNYLRDREKILLNNIMKSLYTE